MARKERRKEAKKEEKRRKGRKGSKREGKGRKGKEKERKGKEVTTSLHKSFRCFSPESGGPASGAGGPGSRRPTAP